MRPDDTERFAALWTRVQPQVGAYVASLVPNLHDCDDILQNVALVVARKWDEYDQTKPFENWVIRIARLEVLKRRQRVATDRHRFSSKVIDRITAAYEESGLEICKRRQAFVHCLRKVAGQPREALRLRYVNNLKPREVGELLGITANAARVMLHRTRKGIHDCIKRRLRQEALL
jgi:RNA polymerase sigma-70 factor (ECF subfamily)